MKVKTLIKQLQKLNPEATIWYEYDSSLLNFNQFSIRKTFKDGRGNICPVTIILPTLAMHAREAAGHICVTNGCKYDGCYTDRNFKVCCVEEFMKILTKKIEEAKDQLIERFDWICSQSPDAAKFMYENGTFYGYKPEEGIRSALKHGTLAMGQLGLAEALQILIGCDHTGRGY